MTPSILNMSKDSPRAHRLVPEADAITYLKPENELELKI